MNQAELNRELRNLIQSHHPVVAFETVEEERVRELAFQVSRQIGLPFFDWSITRGLRSADVPFLAATEDPMTCLQFIKDLEYEGVFLLKDFARHLESPQHIRQFREAAQKIQSSRSTMIIVSPRIELPHEVDHKVIHFPWSLPSRDELKDLITQVYEQLSRTKAIKFELDANDVTSLVNALSGLTLKQARQALTYAMVSDGKLTRTDISQLLDRKARLLKDASLLDYYPPQDLHVSLGGFKNLKAWLSRAQLSATPEARKLGLNLSRGLLLVGVPGCGKSLAAKAIAQQWSRPLLKLDAGRLFDKYIGESEKNFRRAIQSAEAMAPSIFWIDEIEKAMSVDTGGGGSDAGLSRRLFGAFLTWLQEKKSDVFVVATANDLSTLPPELLRKGRFDEVFFVDLPTDEERTSILRIHLEKRQQRADDFDLAGLAKITEGFSGAELEQVVNGALLRAIEAKSPLQDEWLSKEVASTVPLSHSRSEHIDELRELARSRFVPV